MNAEQRRELLSYHRGLAILDVASDRLETAAKSPAHAELRTVVDEIQRAVVKRHVARGRRTAKADRKRELRAAVVARHIAPMVSMIGTYPDRFSNVQSFTAPGARLPDHRFLTVCVVMLGLAQAMREDFEASGMPVSFTKAMEADIEELRALVEYSGIAVHESRGETRTIAFRLQRARKLAGLLTSLVRAMPNLDPALLAAWTSATLHAQRPAHRLSTGPRARRLAAGRDASMKALPGKTETAAERAEREKKTGPIARIAAKARLLLPPGKREIPGD